jgi:hypothetical protein
MGQTIFGLTSSASDGSCEIHDINFVANLSEYESEATVVGRVADALQSDQSSDYYTLKGTSGRLPGKNIYIHRGRKVLR